MGFSYAAARDVIKGASYLSSPSMLRYTVAPSGAVVVIYVSSAGAISRINAYNPDTDWTGTNAWESISGGRTADCGAVLVKPAKPQPTKSDRFWGSIAGRIVKTFAVVTAEVGGELLAGPVGAIIAGQATDIVIGLFADGANKKRETDKDDAWTKVYDSVKLGSACTQS